MEQVLDFCKDTLETVTGFVLNLVREVTAWITHTVAQLTGRAVMYVGKKCWCRNCASTPRSGQRKNSDCASPTTTSAWPLHR